MSCERKLRCTVIPRVLAPVHPLTACTFFVFASVAFDCLQPSHNAGYSFCLAPALRPAPANIALQVTETHKISHHDKRTTYRRDLYLKQATDRATRHICLKVVMALVFTSSFREIRKRKEWVHIPKPVSSHRKDGYYISLYFYYIYSVNKILKNKHSDLKNKKTKTKLRRTFSLRL